jgi:hypothetical protein
VNSRTEGNKFKASQSQIEQKLAEREGLTSTALIFPTTLANFCSNHQRYQSFATVRSNILPVSMEK